MRGPSKQAPDCRDITVVIPSFNRPDRLRACLDALVRCDGEHAIIVVDDGSPQPLSEACATYQERVQFLRQLNQGPAAARNLGAKTAQTPFLAFTDDDCKPDPGWVQALRSALADAPRVLIGGRVVNGLPDNLFSSASQSLCDYLYEHFDVAGGNADFFTSNNIACAKAVFESIGGFDETFPLAAGEDRDFGMRWRQSGEDLRYANDAVIEHFHELTLAKFWRQHRNYGRGARHLHQVMDNRRDGRAKTESLSFYLGILAHPIRSGEPKAIAMAGLMALSQLAMIAGYATQALAGADRGQKMPTPGLTNRMPR